MVDLFLQDKLPGSPMDSHSLPGAGRYENPFLGRSVETERRGLVGAQGIAAFDDISPTDFESGTGSPDLRDGDNVSFEEVLPSETEADEVAKGLLVLLRSLWSRLLFGLG